MQSFLTDAQLCARWQISKITLWRWRRDGIASKPLKPNGKHNRTPLEVVEAVEAGWAERKVLVHEERASDGT